MRRSMAVSGADPEGEQADHDHEEEQRGEHLALAPGGEQQVAADDGDEGVHRPSLRLLPGAGQPHRLVAGEQQQAAAAQVFVEDLA